MIRRTLTFLRTVCEKRGYLLMPSLELASKFMNSSKPLSAPLGARDESLRVPHALYVPNLERGRAEIKEAIKLQIPVIGIIDSDTNPFGIQYPIPGNDDATESVLLYTLLIQNAIAEAKRGELKALSSRKK